MLASSSPPLPMSYINMTHKLIDEDGEEILSIEDAILCRLATASDIKCKNDETGEDIEVDYWNAQATNEDDIPDIVIACMNGFTIFYNDLDKVILVGDTIKYNDHTFQLL